jgi:ribonuclease P protein component
VPGPKVGRITTRAAFVELQRSGSRGSSGPVRAVFVACDPAAPGPYPQVGYAIGKQCGSAVVRNQLRRRAREVVRREAPTLPRGAYLLRFSPPSPTQDRGAFRAHVACALHRAAGLPSTAPPDSAPVQPHPPGAMGEYR